MKSTSFFYSQKFSSLSNINNKISLDEPFLHEVFPGVLVKLSTQMSKEKYDEKQRESVYISQEILKELEKNKKLLEKDSKDKEEIYRNINKCNKDLKEELQSYQFFIPRMRDNGFAHAKVSEKITHNGQMIEWHNTWLFYSGQTQVDKSLLDTKYSIFISKKNLNLIKNADMLSSSDNEAKMLFFINNSDIFDERQDNKKIRIIFDIKNAIKEAGDNDFFDSYNAEYVPEFKSYKLSFLKSDLRYNEKLRKFIKIYNYDAEENTVNGKKILKDNIKHTLSNYCVGLCSKPKDKSVKITFYKSDKKTIHQVKEYQSIKDMIESLNSQNIKVNKPTISRRLKDCKELKENKLMKISALKYNKETGNFDKKTIFGKVEYV